MVLLLHGVSASAWALGWQLVGGYVLARALVGVADRMRRGRGGAARRRVVTWRRARRSLGRAVPFAMLGAAGGAAVRGALGGGLPPLEPLVLGAPGLFHLSATLLAVGTYLVFDAGRLELRGQARAARDQARAGGKLALWATLPLVALPLIRRISHGDGLLVFAAAGFAVVGLGATLAGVGAKPLSAGRLAFVCYAVSLAALHAAIRGQV